MIVYSYKKLSLILFLLLLTQGAWAYDCQKIKDNLFALEHRYQTATLEKCSDNTSERFCKKASDPDSQKTIYEAQLAYNKALAKVNILEGLIAVSAAVENSHLALKTVSTEKLDKAKESIDKFVFNFDQANLISKSMKPNKNGDYLWEGYQGTTEKETFQFIKQKCSDKDSFKNFCDEFTKMMKDSSYNQQEILETLDGFVKADSKINYQKQVREKNYQDYQEYLKFTSKEHPTPVELEKLYDKDADGTSEISKVLKLKSLISSYEQAHDPKIAKQIVTLSNKLQNLDMNYNSSMGLRNESVKKFISDKFLKNLTQISSAAGILTGTENIKHNFSEVNKSLAIDLSGKEQYLLKNFSTLKNKIPNCQAKNAATIGECLAKVCGNEYPEHCPQTSANKDLFASGLGQMFGDYKSYHQADLLAQANKAMMQCMDDKFVNNLTDKFYEGKSIVEKKQACLDHNKKEIAPLIGTDNLADAKKEFADAKKTLDFLNNGNNIKRILAEKYMTIKALQTNHCLSEQNYERTDNLNSFCKLPDMNRHLTTALKLKGDIGDILVKYDLQRYKTFLSDSSLTSTNDRSYYKKMIADCKSNKNSSSVCPYFLEEEDKRLEQKRKEAALQKRREEILASGINIYGEKPYSHSENNNERSAFSYAIGGLTTGVVQNMPGLFNYFQTRQMHTRQMQMWDNQLNYYNYYWGAGANHHTYNVQVNYDDWYANQSAFNSTGYNYLTPQTMTLYPSYAPPSYTSGNGQIYIPATTGTSTSTATSFSF